jgi:hypothetical protein
VCAADGAAQVLRLNNLLALEQAQAYESAAHESQQLQQQLFDSFTAMQGDAAKRQERLQQQLALAHGEAAALQKQMQTELEQHEQEAVRKLQAALREQQAAFEESRERLKALHTEELSSLRDQHALSLSTMEQQMQWQLDAWQQQQQQQQQLLLQLHQEELLLQRQQVGQEAEQLRGQLQEARQRAQAASNVVVTTLKRAEDAEKQVDTLSLELGRVSDSLLVSQRSLKEVQGQASREAALEQQVGLLQECISSQLLATAHPHPHPPTRELAPAAAEPSSSPSGQSEIEPVEAQPLDAAQLAAQLEAATSRSLQLETRLSAMTEMVRKVAMERSAGGRGLSLLQELQLQQQQLEAASVEAAEREVSCTAAQLLLQGEAG